MITSFRYICIVFYLSLLFSQIIEDKITIPIYQINNTQYISAYEYANANQADLDYDKEKKKLEIKSDYTKNITLSQNSSFIIVNQNIYHLFSPVLYKNNDFLIPIKSFLNTMNSIMGPRGFIDTSSNNLIMYTKKTVNINNISIKTKSNGIIINIDTKKKFDTNVISGSQDQELWFNLTIPDGIIDSTKIVNTKNINPIKRIRCVQHKESAQISFLINDQIDDHQFQSDDNSLTVDLRMNTEENTAKIKNKIRDSWLIDTIIIDAGHGGKDPGAIGVGGIKEKDIVLDVAKRLGKLLEQNLDVTVIYTRKDDTFIPLHRRAKIAQQNNGKLFISLHANSGAHGATGFETYLLRPGKWENAIEVVKRENAVIQLESDQHKYKDFTDEEHILGSNFQTQIIKESEFLASQVQIELNKVLPIKNRGVKQAGFQVLNEASNMPNILIELGFLTHKKDSKYLKKSKYKQRMAEAIFRAIKTYKKEVEGYSN